MARQNRSVHMGLGNDVLAKLREQGKHTYSDLFGRALTRPEIRSWSDLYRYLSAKTDWPPDRLRVQFVSLARRLGFLLVGDVIDPMAVDDMVTKCSIALMPGIRFSSRTDDRRHIQARLRLVRNIDLLLELVQSGKIELRSRSLMTALATQVRLTHDREFIRDLLLEVDCNGLGDFDAGALLSLVRMRVCDGFGLVDKDLANFLSVELSVSPEDVAKITTLPDLPILRIQAPAAPRSRQLPEDQEEPPATPDKVTEPRAAPVVEEEPQAPEAPPASIEETKDEITEVPAAHDEPSGAEVIQLFPQDRPGLRLVTEESQESSGTAPVDLDRFGSQLAAELLSVDAPDPSDGAFDAPVATPAEFVFHEGTLLRRQCHVNFVRVLEILVSECGWPYMHAIFGDFLRPVVGLLVRTEDSQRISNHLNALRVHGVIQTVGQRPGWRRPLPVRVNPARPWSSALLPDERLREVIEAVLRDVFPLSQFIADMERVAPAEERVIASSPVVPKPVDLDDQESDSADAEPDPEPTQEDPDVEESDSHKTGPDPEPTPDQPEVQESDNDEPVSNEAVSEFVEPEPAAPGPASVEPAPLPEPPAVEPPREAEPAADTSPGPAFTPTPPVAPVAVPELVLPGVGPKSGPPPIVPQSVADAISQLDPLARQDLLLRYCSDELAGLIESGVSRRLANERRVLQEELELCRDRYAASQRDVHAFEEALTRAEATCSRAKAALDDVAERLTALELLIERRS